MMKRLFKIIISHEIEFDLELDDAVLGAVNEEWRKSFYNLTTDDEIASHISLNMCRYRLTLSDLDGFADQPNSNAIIIDRHDDYDITAEAV